MRERDARRSIRANVLLGAVVLFGLGGSAAAWAVLAPLSGAIVAPAAVVVESNVRKVQHPTGGVVGALNVREGDRVEAGQIVLTLDETQIKARWRVVADQLTEGRLRAARLRAERDGRESIAFPSDLLEAARADADIRAAIEGQTHIFEARRRNRLGQIAQLRERIGQLFEENKGYEAQLLSAKKMSELADREAEVAEDMFARNLALRDRVFNIRRERARLEGQIGAVTATMAQNRGKAAETELQILQLDKDFEQKVAEELRDVETKISELTQRKIEAEDQLRRVEVRAPISGYVHQLQVFTVGGVVSPTEPMMLVVPENEPLIVEARVSPIDIDQIRVGQPVRLRFSAFNQRTTPELTGTVTRVSANRSEDPQTRMSYYTVGVLPDPGEIDKLKPLRLVAGMPVETYFATGERTAWSYLTKPLVEHWGRALREE